MEKVSLNVKEWAEMTSQSPEDDCNIPIWFRVTGNSMYPFVRANIDDILLVPVKPEDLMVGDIVLFPGKYKGGDYCLHRLIKIDDEQVQTFGDGNLRPDRPFPKKNIIGKAVLIKRGRITIDCEDPKWIKRFNRWNSLWRIRKFLLLPFRIIRKIKRILGIEETV
ncbi:MAG: S26 family signal peptidase [Lachnospiraceae bacterium]|nr:S26 family signal peptidase [Lachnospiraceae bacterium]